MLCPPSRTFFIIQIKLVEILVIIGILGACFQYFVDANKILDISELDVEVLDAEKLKVLETRTCAFGDNFRYYPPWKK